MRILLASIDRSSRTLETLAVFLLFAYCILMLAEVIARSFYGKSLPQSWEFSTFSMAAVFLLASGPAFRTATHVRVSLLLECVPSRWAYWLDGAANLVALVIVGVIVSAIFDAFLTSMNRELVSASIVRTPLAIPQGLLVLGAIQLWLDLLARFIRLLSRDVYEFPASDAIVENVSDV